MLKQLRNKKTAKRILWILAIIVIPPFVFWGAGGLLRQKGEINYAGKIFGRKIGFSEYRNSYLAVRNQWVLRYGEENFEKLEKYLGLSQQAWERLILLYETDKRRLKIKDSEVISTIEKMPIFQKNNLFDQKVYDYILRYILRTPARLFEENLRDGLKISKLYEEVTAGINASDQELETEYKKENEQIKVEYALISPKEYKANIKIEDKEIKEYFEKEKQSFLHPASVNMEYLGIDYPQNPKELDKDKTREKLQQVRANIKTPQDFEKISEEQSLAIKETGFFSQNEDIPQIGWSEELSKVCLGLAQNEISPPIETAKGVYIFRLKEKRGSYMPEIDEVKNQIMNILTEQKSYSLAKEGANEILTQLKNSRAKNQKESFAGLTKSLGLEIRETPLFKRNDPIEGIGKAEEFANAAFGLLENTISEVIEANKNFYIILGVKQFVGIDKEKFTKERQDFKDKLLTRKKEEAFMKFIQELETKAKITSYISQDYNPNLYR